MKKKVVSGILLGFALVAGLTACDNNKNPDNGQTETKIVDSSTETASEAAELASYKQAANNKLITLIKSAILKIENEDLKKVLQDFYDAEEEYIASITDLETAKAAANKIADDAKKYIKDTFIPLAVTKLNSVINPLIAEIKYEPLKEAVTKYYEDEIKKFEKYDSFDNITFFLKEIVGDTKAFIAKQTTEIIAELKDKALEELDPYVKKLIDSIPFDSIKANLTTFYTTEKAKLEAVDTIEGVEPLTAEIKADLLSYAIKQVKDLALENLDKVVNPVLAKIANDDLKTSITNFYNTTKAEINKIEDLDSATSAVNNLTNNIKAFVKDTLLPLALDKIDAIIDPLIEKIDYDSLKTSVQSYYDNLIKNVSGIESLDDVSNLYDTIISDTEAFIKSETEKIVIELKNKALETLDPYVEALIAKIPYDSLKNDVNAFYVEEKKILAAVNTISGVDACVEEIKEDLEEFALAEAKKIAIDSLDDVVDAGLDKLPNEELKQNLNDFADTEIEKLNKVSKVEDIPSTLETIIEETEAYVKSLLADMVKGYLTKLTRIETTTAYDYLPKAMSPYYEQNLVDPAEVNYDFTNFTNVSEINIAGFGEQWQMVVENINQSVAFAKVFNLAQTVLNAAGNALNIYIENSYAEEMSQSFGADDYKASFEFKNDKLTFEIELKTPVVVPGIGQAWPKIEMKYDLKNEEKSMKITINDNNMFKYIISNSKYLMVSLYGLTVMGQTASRKSYLSIDNYSAGHIYEFTTVGDKTIKACADFYIEDGYVAVVGNKASGMVGFDGSIVEVYNSTTGHLVGYEVKEEMTVSIPIIGDKTFAYDTLWFNLVDVSLITSIKVCDKTDNNNSSKSTVDVYINGSDELFVPTYNTFSKIKTSRKYDIELRTRFYYSHDEETDTYSVHEVKIPMIFIQEDNENDTNFTDYPNDMYNANGIKSEVTLAPADLKALLFYYDQIVYPFSRNKEAVEETAILSVLFDGSIPSKYL